jgi:alpha-methylacyl-CoA racemase
VGPLTGLKIIEVSAIGPGPYCGMMLADMGADLVCVDRTIPPILNPATDCTRRGKRSIVLDLKSKKGHDMFMCLLEKADAVFEGFRPGVMEDFGLGPAECMAVNPRLVYGRMTGWGQTGPLSKVAGHDINYISLTGLLHAIGRRGEKPVPPLNVAGDFGGGAMFLAFGMVCALLEAQKSGMGQVIDAAMTDGSALLMSLFHSLEAQGMWTDKRGSNMLDSGAHFYEVYETSDGKYVSIGSIEPQFYALLIEKAGLDVAEFSDQNNPERWPDLKIKLEAVFKRKSRREWCELMEGTDVCFAPVLGINEAPMHPHNIERETYISVGGMTQPAPAPRFSRTKPEVVSCSQEPGSNLEAVLNDWGIVEKNRRD